MSEWEPLESRHPIWKPNTKGQSLEGTVIGKGTAFDQSNASIQTAKGIFTTPAHVNLSGSVEQMSVGDYVRVTYNGIIKRKGKNDYESYSVQRRKAKESP